MEKLRSAWDTALGTSLSLKRIAGAALQWLWMLMMFYSIVPYGFSSDVRGSLYVSLIISLVAMVVTMLFVSVIVRRERVSGNRSIVLGSAIMMSAGSVLTPFSDPTTPVGMLVLGLSVMCAIQTALSAAHFISERKSSLTDVLNGATALSERFADEGSIVTRPLQGEDLVERAHSGFELFNTTSGALVFIADKGGSILLHTGDEAFTGANVPPAYIAQLDEGSDIFETGTLDGVYNAKYYTAGRRITVGGQDGYLFAASPMNALGSYMTDMLAMFGISAAAILLLCSVLCWVLARRITGPIEDISEAARRLGSGDFTARAPVDGCVELADFATTFNNMAARLQTIDNSRGQFMGNIAHELRTPMTTIKGFIDGMLDGTIPQEETKHYLGIVSQETGRLARLAQNMLDQAAQAQNT